MPLKEFMTLGQAARKYPQLTIDAGRAAESKVFVKSSERNVFESEEIGLKALWLAHAIRVAEVIACGRNGTRYVIVLEAVESTTPRGEFFERFGSQLAQMHRSSQSEQFGFESDNFIGETAQPNTWNDSWVQFWAHSRIGFQLKLAHQNGFDGELQWRGELLLRHLDSLIGSPEEQPVLIHGDLWSGNWICDENCQPALIDPAVYYASREAEFGMTTLFGGLPSEFYGAYNEAWPMESGWRERVAIYRLYHLLNHLNLFGSSYLGDCLAVLKRFS